MNAVPIYSAMQSRVRKSPLLWIVLAGVLSSFSLAENASSEVDLKVAQFAAAVNQAHNAWADCYSDTSYLLKHVEYLEGQVILDRVFELKRFGLGKFRGSETYGYERCSRLVQDTPNFAYYETEARDFDGKGSVYLNSLWKSDGKSLRVLHYPIGKSVSELLLLPAQAPASDYIKDPRESRAKGPPNGKDTPWGIVMSALGFSAEKSPNEVFITDDLAETISKSSLIQPPDQKSFYMLKVADKKSSNSIQINTATHLPEAVEYVEKDGIIIAEIEVAFFQLEELHSSAAFPRKVTWKTFIVDGGRKRPLLEKVLEVTAVSFGSKTVDAEFDIGSIKSPIETMNGKIED